MRHGTYSCRRSHSHSFTGFVPIDNEVTTTNRNKRTQTPHSLPLRQVYGIEDATHIEGLYLNYAAILVLVVPYILISVGMFIVAKGQLGDVEYYNFCIGVRQRTAYRVYVNFAKFFCICAVG